MTHRKVQDLMTTNVSTAYVNTPVKTIAEQLDRTRITALPVLDDDANVVGVVSETDLLHKITYQDDTDEWPRLFRRHRVDRAKAEGLVAKDLMSSPAITITPDASVVEAAQLMEERRIKRAPVVNATGKLVGIISRGDLIRLFVQSDASILHEVQTDVLGRIMLHPPGVTAEVTDGIVTLRGELPRRSDIELAIEFTRRVDGVISVEHQLTFAHDDMSYRAVLGDVDRPVGPFL